MALFDSATSIATIGFASSLIVVLINSCVTLFSKKIDAQVKKDEQSYGFRMEYVKRKLSAGEKEITSLLLSITTISTLQQYYASCLLREDEVIPDELEDYKTKLYDSISAKNRQYILEENYGFNAYFQPSPNSNKINKLTTEHDALNDRIVIANESVTAIKSLLIDIDSQNSDRKDELEAELSEEIKNRSILMLAHIQMAQEIINEYTDLIQSVREEMLAIVS